MADHLTEEEQIEAIKKWWSENWKLIVLPILALGLGYGGWTFNAYQSETRSLKASQSYTQLVALVSEASADEAKRSEAITVATELAEGYSSSLYGNLSNLILARLAFEDGSLDDAKKYLNEAKASAVTDEMTALADYRLAKVHLESGDKDAALALVANTSLQAYKGLYAELRGDVFVAQGNFVGARSAYLEALTSSISANPEQQQIIQLKLNGLSLREAKAKQSADASDEAQAEAEVSESEVETN